uniref:Immunoglobulin C1-set domain-containing protein n=1 Tax=Gadus morhua TaxID=8049 RepID=A0A8C5A321_GADMO
ISQPICGLAAWIQTGIIVFLSTAPPEVYISARPFENNLNLSCLATGFHPKEITMNIRRDGHLVDRYDGPDVKSGRTFVRCGGDVRRARPSVWEERGVLGYLGNI